MKTNLSKINLNLLVAFDVLLQERNVTKAAQKLSLTQSAVSHILKQLRYIFQDDLLIRGQSSSMIPTKKALALVKPLKEIMQNINNIFDDGSFNPKTATQTFTLGMSDYSEFVLLPAMIQFFNQNAPNINLVIKHLNFFENSKIFENDIIDLAVGVYYDIPKDLIARDIFTDRSVCVGWDQNPLLAKPICGKTFAKAKHVVVLYYEDLAKTPSEIYIKKLGYKRKVIATVPHTLPVLYSLPNTDLICVAFERIVNKVVNNLSLKTQPVAVKECSKFSVNMVWHPKNRNNSAHLWLRNSIIDLAKTV